MVLGKSRYAGTTFRSWFAMFKMWFECCGRGDLVACGGIIIEKNISKWEKVQVVKKAPVFEKSDLCTYFLICIFCFCFIFL